MAEGYNFEKYYKDTTAKAEVNIDLSGLDIENPVENLNEHVTNNVMYFISYIWGSNSSDFSTYKQFDINDRLAIKDESEVDERNQVITNYTFASRLHPIDSLLEADVTAQWEPGYKREFYFDLDEQDTNSGITYLHCDDSGQAGTVYTPYKYIRIFVFPRYEAIDGNATSSIIDRVLPHPFDDMSSSVNQNPIGVASNYSNLPTQMRMVYALTGMWGNRYLGFKWFFRNMQGKRLSRGLKSNAVFSEKAFKSRIKYMSNLAAEKNYGIDVKYYDKTYAEEVTAEDANRKDWKRNKSFARLKHRTYKYAVRKADITRTQMSRRTSFNAAYSKHLPLFMNNPKCNPLVDNMIKTADGITALVPPLKDAVKSIFFDKEDLENDFFDTFESVYEGLMKVAGKLRKYLKAKTVAKLVATGKRYQNAPTGNHDVAFDMQYMLNILYKKIQKLDGDLTGSGYEVYNSYSGYPDDPSNPSGDKICCYPRVYEISARLVSNYDVHGTKHTGYAVKAFAPGMFIKRSDGGFKCACKSYYAVPTDSGARAAANIANSQPWKDDYYFISQKSSLYGDATDHFAPRNKIINTMTGREVKELLIEYYNWVASYGGREVPFEYTMDDLCEVDGKKGDYRYGWNWTSCSKVSGTNDTYQYNNDPNCKIKITSGHTPAEVNGLNQFVEYVGAYMNFFATKTPKNGKGGFGSYASEAARDVHISAGSDSGMAVGDWLNILCQNGLSSWTIDDESEYNVIGWGQSSDPAEIYSTRRFMAGYETEWTLDSETPDDIDEAIQFAFVMRRTYRELRRLIRTKAFRIGLLTAYRCSNDLDDIDEDFDKLSSTINKINWYQLFVNESAFTNHSIVGDFTNWLRGSSDASADEDDASINTGLSVWNLPARFMVPVRLSEKRKVKVRIWGRTRHRYRRFSIGVRWAEVRFYDLNVYNEYPQVNDTPGRMVTLGIPGEYTQLSNGTYSIEVAESFPNDIIDAKEGELVVNGDEENRIRVTITDDTTMITEDSFGDTSGEITLTAIKLPPEKSRNDKDEKTNITIRYKMPSLPYDEEIRKKAFTDYGPFSQDKLFEVYRFGDGGFGNGKERHDGWKIFHDSSRKIEDLRVGVDIYNKVAMLISILKHEFGNERVELIDTYRSADDQAMFCTGGPESAFLSWHNYGLAAKIVIYQDDLTTPIEDKSDDMMHLVKVARAFTECCNNGVFGAPCNLIWCGRLVINPSLFDWEFLPVGVGHKDAPKFRDLILAQRDPVVELGYVDVDARGYVSSTSKENEPYILRNSSAYKNSSIIDGHHYVSPRYIKNYDVPDDIVLYDIIEFINLVQTKMGANGSTLTDKASMREWKALNDAACTQLIMYYALTNNVSAAKSLIAGEYMEQYQPYEDGYYESDAVGYVKGMLGNLYDDAVITIDRDTDASYITLKDGILHVRATDIYPDNLATMNDMHKQQSVDRNHIKRGIWKDGIFYTEEESEVPYTDSEKPVISGYNDITGEPEIGDAMYLHRIVATQIHDEFEKNTKRFLNFSGALLYDTFQDGPNAKMYDMLENEFGLIKAQDLMDFDELEAMLNKTKINELADKFTDSDGTTILGAGRDRTVYEEVVDHAELAGIRKANITREKVHINDRANGLTVEQLYKLVTQGTLTSGHDVLE